MEVQQKDKTLDLAISQIEKQFGQGDIMRMGENSIMKVESISTGSISLNSAIGIGGAPIIGTTMKDVIKLFMNDSETDGIIMIGEIGGQLEADAAQWIKINGSKPVVGFIAGQTAPEGRTMGHAGAIVGGKDDTAIAKMKILESCGILVSESPANIGKMMADAITS